MLSERQDRRLRRAGIGLTMGRMMMKKMGKVDDDQHNQAGDGGWSNPREHRSLEQQAQGSPDCPPGRQCHNFLLIYKKTL